MILSYCSTTPIVVKKCGNKQNKNDNNINVAEGDEARVSESSTRSQSTAERSEEQAPVAPINSSGHIVRDVPISLGELRKR